MEIKRDIVNDSLNPASTDIVTWGEKYAVGITAIDKQHRELVDLTNMLYHACLARSEDIETTFKNAMSRLVEYVRFHFTDEQILLQRLKFPLYAEHKKEHDKLIRNILEAAKDYSAGKKYVPNQFVRTLKDWIFGHIAVTDKVYAAYVNEEKRKGLFTDL